MASLYLVGDEEVGAAAFGDRAPCVRTLSAALITKAKKCPNGPVPSTESYAAGGTIKLFAVAQAEIEFLDLGAAPTLECGACVMSRRALIDGQCWPPATAALRRSTAFRVACSATRFLLEAPA